MPSAESLSYRLVPETCPIIDKELHKARQDLISSVEYSLEKIEDRVKEQTNSLRAALVEVLKEKIEAEEHVEMLKDEVKDLNKQLDDLSYQLSELENNQMDGD